LQKHGDSLSAQERFPSRAMGECCGRVAAGMASARQPKHDRFGRIRLELGWI
jgi:hypothetical protein